MHENTHTHTHRHRQTCPHILTYVRIPTLICEIFNVLFGSSHLLNSSTTPSSLIQEQTLQLLFINTGGQVSNTQSGEGGREGGRTKGGRMRIERAGREEGRMRKEKGGR